MLATLLKKDTDTGVSLFFYYFFFLYYFIFYFLNFSYGTLPEDWFSRLLESIEMNGKLGTRSFKRVPDNYLNVY